MNKKEITEMITGHCAGVASTQENGLVATKVYIDDLADELVNLFSIHGVVKPLNFNINKDLKIKSLGDLKRAYPDNHSHRVSSFGGCINYFVDGQLVYERKI